MLRALIVDDEGIERRGIAMLIERLMLPYQTRDASNGEAALEILRRERFDVLLTDIRMPFMDGLSLAHEARRLYPELYIIIFSAYADFTNAQRAMQENVTRYLLKPVNVLEFKAVMTEVAEKIEKAVRRRHDSRNSKRRFCATARKRHLRKRPCSARERARIGRWDGQRALRKPSQQDAPW